MFSRGDRGPLGEVLRRVGRPGEVEFVRTRDISEIRFPGRDGRIVRVAVPADVHRMPRFCVELARALDLPWREAARAARLFAYLLTMTDDEVDAWNDRTVDELVQRFTSHPATIGLFGFLLGLYFILPYWEVSAGEALWCFRRMARDNALSYPIGGAIAIPSTYVRLAQELGAEVRTGTGARRIVVEGGRVRGVELPDGTVLPADLVDVDVERAVDGPRPRGGGALPGRVRRPRAESSRGSFIAVQAKIALRRPLVSAGSIVGGVGEDADLSRVTTADMRAMFEKLQHGEVPPVMPFYCPVPTSFDPSLAPPGHQLLTVCAVAPTSDVALKDDARVSAGRDDAHDRAGRPGDRRGGTLRGTCFSVSFIEEMDRKGVRPGGVDRPDARLGGRAAAPRAWTPLRGLYVAGCGAGARGRGDRREALAAASAMECVDRILADLGRALRPLPARTAPRAVRDLAVRAAAAPVAWATRA